VGVAVKTHHRGEGCGSDRKAILESVSQVLRAANGFAALCAENPKLSLRQVQSIRIVPAVFTTADLTKTDVDLVAANLASGNLPDSVGFESIPWLWFQHPLNRSMQAPVQARYVAEDWEDWTDYFLATAVRSVAIVKSAEPASSSMRSTAAFF
jgi:hypothetical protein